MTTINAIGGGGAMPTQHYPPAGGCGHHSKPMPAPMPMPMPRPGPPGPTPPHLPTPPAPPVGMHGLHGGTTGEIARGILELYDRDRSGVITAEEAVRVQRDHGGFDGGMLQVPGKFGYGSTTVDVFAMTKLLVKADANHDGRVGVNELASTLKAFDRGDSYGSFGLPPHGGPGQHFPKPGGKTAGDGRLSGSEFDRFMSELGEQHIGSWQEPSYWGSYFGDRIPRRMDLGPATPLRPVNDSVPQPATAAAAPTSQAAATAVGVDD